MQIGDILWHIKRLRREEQKIFLTRKFTVGSDLAKAVFQITVDDYFTAYVNGKKVSSGGNWNYYRTTDVTKLLVKGENTIAIEAGNWEGASGVLADLTLTGNDGKVRHIVTDASWQVSGKAQPSDWKTAGLKPAQAAKKLFDFGKGPWK